MTSAIVGCGGIAQVHARVLDSLGISLVAAADIIPERAEKLTAEHGGKAYSSLTDLLSAEKPDVLHICTPHYLHVPMALEALPRGVNVLMEKPPAISEEQFAALSSFQTDAKLGICYQNRYNSEVVEAKRILDSGKAGKILGARAFVTWRRDDLYYTQSGWRGKAETEGGGVIINQSVHTIDLLCYLLGHPVSVEASTCNHHLKDIIEVEDTAEAYVTFENGSTAIFYATTAFCTDSAVTLDIICENMSLHLEGVNSYIEDSSGRKPFGSDGGTFGKKCYGSSHPLLIADFYDAVANSRDFAVGLSDVSDSFSLFRGILNSHGKIINIFKES